MVLVFCSEIQDLSCIPIQRDNYNRYKVYSSRTLLLQNSQRGTAQIKFPSAENAELSMPVVLFNARDRSEYICFDYCQEFRLFNLFFLSRFTQFHFPQTSSYILAVVSWTVSKIFFICDWMSLLPFSFCQPPTSS